MVGIYKITSPSGKTYVGQSWDIKKRWYKYRCNACQQQRHLFNSFQKHGVRNHLFELLHELPYDVTQEIIDDYEKLYIDLFKSAGFIMLNLMSGNSRGKHSDETKLKMKGTKGRKANSGSFKKGKPLPRTKEWIKKVADNWVGRKHSEESKKRMSESKKGEKGPMFGKRHPPETIAIIAAKNRGKVVSEETRKKISENRNPSKYWLGKQRSEETKEKIRLTKTGVKQNSATVAKRSASIKQYWKNRK